jgi:hypothetical protein
MEAASPRVTLASALPDDWKPSDEDVQWAGKARPDLTPALLTTETERFRNHAQANNRQAHNWGPAWRNWISKADAASPAQRSNGKPDPTALPTEEPWEARLNGWREKRFWMPQMWGPPPGEAGCRVPSNLRSAA